MLYTERQQLTIIEVENSKEGVSIEKLKNVLIKHPSNMIYCELKGKLIGIISTGDIVRAYEKKQDMIAVNKKYTYLHVGEYIMAKTILEGGNNINALPVVTEDNTLLGEYMRWNDLNYMEYKLKATGGQCVPDLGNGQQIIFVRPCGDSCQKQKIFLKFKETLESQDIKTELIDHSDVYRYLDNANKILFVDENEIRACRTVLTLMFGRNYCGTSKLMTYKTIVVQNNITNKRCTAYFKDLCDKGIHIMGLTYDADVCHQELLKKLRDKFAAAGEPCGYRVPRCMYKGFFDDLYSEEYAEQILSIPFKVEYNKGILRLKDCHGQYYNVVNGERYTSGQPEKFVKNIYFFGPCYIYGYYVEDKYTIESILQKRLCREQFAIRVINCGCVEMNTEDKCLSRIAGTQLRKGDIVIMDAPPRAIKGAVYLNMNKIIEEKEVNLEWMVDDLFHSNHKLNKLYADAIYETLEHVLIEKVDGQGELIEKDDDFIKMLYLDQYFTGFDPSKYKEIGSIVMNCNPFTYGHRYLIEQALQRVEFVIIFVVEEDRSFFSFEDRFVMVSRGVADLKNVMVVPSGQYILSQMSFPEYFIKETSEDLVEHTKQDIITFAECIAPQLGIHYRFVGEEPEDDVTNQYNLAMKKIFPHYGIELIEIPRRKVNGKCISASSVRQYMEEKNIDRLQELLPMTTRTLIGYCNV